MIICGRNRTIGMGGEERLLKDAAHAAASVVCCLAKTRPADEAADMVRKVVEAGIKAAQDVMQEGAE